MKFQLRARRTRRWNATARANLTMNPAAYRKPRYL